MKMEYSETVRQTPTPTISKTRKMFGYAIGILGLIVSGLIIFGFGHEFFHIGRKRLTAEEKLRPAYETVLSFLPGKKIKNKKEKLKKYFLLIIFCH